MLNIETDKLTALLNKISQGKFGESRAHDKAIKIKESADFNSNRTRISKRGSPYLRRAIWQAAFVASFHDLALSLHYQKLRKRGKVHGTTVGAVARKLKHIIFAILRDNKPYEPRPQINNNN